MMPPCPACGSTGARKPVRPAKCGAMGMVVGSFFLIVGLFFLARTVASLFSHREWSATAPDGIPCMVVLGFSAILLARDTKVRCGACKHLY